MAVLAKLWSLLKRVPAGLWWVLSAFFGGLLIALRIMGTKVKVRDVKEIAEKDLAIIDEHRRDLKEAGNDPEKLRDELLKNIRDER